MANINLLPWREERRMEAKRNFFAILIVCAIMGAGSVYLAELNTERQIENQRARNQFVEQEIAKLDEEIKEIEELEKERNRLRERMDLIQNLQGTRSVIVHHFDQTVRSVPDGVYFTRLEKKGARFNIEGIADANSRVSSLMRNFDISPWFKQPVLTRVTNVEEGDADSAAKFVLSVMEETPNQVSGSD
ncbi:MAG: PilN domain-containing protein [Gammaproteobacteria bacterium]